MEKSYKEYLNTINTFVFDVDGVLSENALQVNIQGELLRNIYVKDFYAIEKAIKEGFLIFFMSENDINGLQKQLQLIGVTQPFFNTKDKVKLLNQIVDKHNIKLNQVLYMGDDLLDINPMLTVALPCCPQDASPEVKAISKYVSHKNGGKGCIRDVIEQVLKVQEKW